jgi:NADH:ubiquinone oxidoreductase subunit F (NADH-binding)
MNKYSVEVRMSYYVWVDVEAVDEYSAKDRALRGAHEEQKLGMGVWGEEHQIVLVIKKEPSNETTN